MGDEDRLTLIFGHVVAINRKLGRIEGMMVERLEKMEAVDRQIPQKSLEERREDAVLDARIRYLYTLANNLTRRVKALENMGHAKSVKEMSMEELDEEILRIAKNLPKIDVSPKHDWIESHND